MIIRVVHEAPIQGVWHVSVNINHVRSHTLIIGPCGVGREEVSSK